MSQQESDNKGSEPTAVDDLAIPDEIPILPTMNLVLYPEMIAPILVFSEKLMNIVDSVITESKVLGMVAHTDTEQKDPGPDDLYQYGVATRILKMLKMPDGRMNILVQGLVRIRLDEFVQTDPHMVARISTLEDVVESSVELEALTQNVLRQFEQMMSMVPNMPEELKITLLNIQEPGKLADFIASNLGISIAEKQEILELINVKDRLQRLTVFLNREQELLEMGHKIQKQVKTEYDSQQREYFLRQQLKAIQEELGEGDERAMELKELKEKIEQAGMPPEAEKTARQELDRLLTMPPAAAEYTVSRTYLDWLVNLPWSKSTEDVVDIKKAHKVLEEDHYDLEKVKERILEYLAVRKLKEDMKGPILCFVGPPGVGKTSLGMSIARALGRNFIRLSLGGVRDEAEIRGHRRTYVGALPGRIIQGIRKTGSNNPVFMLDEVDKLGADFRGDPSSALLEVLDPEQNFSFSDHYLEIPFDLSKVMFITTANLLDTVPPALRDRMEVLELPGYIDEEKIQIARKYLIPKQLTEHGLGGNHVNFEDDALHRIIRYHTREAGLRNLEREIATVCRKVARDVVEGRGRKRKISIRNLSSFLGPAKFFPEVAERTSEPGVATGLAWTAAGGDILFVESTKMRGGKGLTLTGQLGDVMKESAQAALSYLRSRSDGLGIEEDFFEKYDIHVHVPAGAVPKDGPSAGITIATSLASLLTGRATRSDVAMTGEVTLRGKVLPVGGIKEKVLAAKRAGIPTVILPSKNKKDLNEIPPKLRKGMTFKFVGNVDQVISIALQDTDSPRPPARRRKKAA